MMIINEEEFKALIQEAVEAALEKTRVPNVKEIITEDPEPTMEEKCGLDPEPEMSPTPEEPAPEWTHDEFRKEHLMPLLKSQPNPTEATAKAKAVIKDMFDVDKFGDIPVEDLHATYEAIRAAL